MADAPVQDNTKATEDLTEVLKEVAQRNQALPEMFRAPPPSPSQSLAPPPTPPQRPVPPPSQAPMAKWMSAEQVADYQRRNPPPPQPPPIPPHMAMFHTAVGGAMEQLDVLGQLRAAGVDMKSPAAKGVRDLAKLRAEFAGQEFAGMSPENQQKSLPIMQALEQRRKEVEEEDLKRRRQMNEATARSTDGLSRFGAGLARLTGLGGATTPMGAALTGLGLLGQVLQKIHRESVAGVGLSNPTVGQTGQTSEQLRLAAQAEYLNTPETERARNRFRQANALLGHEEARRGETGFSLTQFLRGMASGPVSNDFITQAQRGFQAFETARLNRATEKLEEEMRRRGLLRPGERFQAKEDQVLPAQPGITTALGFQSELQVGALQRNDASNELLRRQLEELRRQGGLLETVERNTDNLADIRPRWQ